MIEYIEKRIDIGRRLLGERIKISGKLNHTKRRTQAFPGQKHDILQNPDRSISEILYLQSTIGNQAIQNLLKPGITPAMAAEQMTRISGSGIQPKPTLTPANPSCKEEVLREKPIDLQPALSIQQQIEDEGTPGMDSCNLPHKMSLMRLSSCVIPSELTPVLFTALRRSARTSTQTPMGSSLPLQPAQPVQNLHMANCDLFNPRKVRWSYNASRRWINSAVPQIRQFPGGPNSAVVRTALNDNFHTTAASDVATILQNYEDIQLSFFTGRTVDCFPRACRPGDLAWVITCGSLAGIPHRTIHLCPDFWSCTNQYIIGGTFIHESAHTENCADDHAYEHHPTYAGLSSADAIDNADSYVVAARQIHYTGAHGPGETC
jgi:hypothetical protein